MAAIIRLNWGKKQCPGNYHQPHPLAMASFALNDGIMHRLINRFLFVLMVCSSESHSFWNSSRPIFPSSVQSDSVNLFEMVNSISSFGKGTWGGCMRDIGSVSNGSGKLQPHDFAHGSSNAFREWGIFVIE